MGWLIVKLLLINLGAAALSWWLSGFDRHLREDGSRADLTRRLVRCGLTIICVECGIWCQWYCFKYHDPSAFILYLALLALILFLWVGCLTDAAARLLVFLTDPVGQGKHDPDRVLRDLDRLAGLVRDNHKDEALTLCQELEANHEISVQAAQEIRARLGAGQNPAAEIKSLAKALQLQRTGKWVEAEAILLELRQSEPRNMEVAFALMRLYLRDLKKPEQARSILNQLANQPHISRHHIEYATGSFDEWSKPVTPISRAPEPSPTPVESIAELISQKRFGSAIEAVEQQIAEQPGNFDLRLQLIELEGRYCGNFNKATKLLYLLKTNPAFNQQQFQFAMDKLAEWRVAAAR